MAEDKDRVNEAKEQRQKTLDKLGGDSIAKTYRPKAKTETEKTEEESTA